MELTIKFHDTLIPLAPAIQIKGAEKWELDMIHEAAFDHCTDDEYAELRNCVAEGKEFSGKSVQLSIVRLHGNVRMESFFSICRIQRGATEKLEVGSVEQAHDECKARSVIKGEAIIAHGVTMQQAGKRTRTGKAGTEWEGMVDRDTKYNPFTDEYMENSIPVIASFKSDVLFAYITD